MDERIRNWETCISNVGLMGWGRAFAFFLRGNLTAVFHDHLGGSFSKMEKDRSLGVHYFWIVMVLVWYGLASIDARSILFGF